MAWTPKSFGQYWSHPIFTPRGCLHFWNELVSSFWRGELYWHGARLGAWQIDAVIVVSSTLFLLAFVVAEVAGIGGAAAGNRLDNAMCLLVFALSVAILIFSSVSFDFGTCCYPSRQCPYFTSGRLILGALAPFLIMYLRGLDVLQGWLRWKHAGLSVLIVLVGLMIVWEGTLLSDVCASPYNWFHLP